MARFKELFHSVKEKDYENDARILGLSQLIEKEVSDKLQSKYFNTRIKRKGIEYDLVKVLVNVYLYGSDPEEFGIYIYTLYVITNPDEKDKELANLYRYWFNERLPMKEHKLYVREMYNFSLDDYLNDNIDILIYPSDENKDETTK